MKRNVLINSLYDFDLALSELRDGTTEKETINGIDYIRTNLGNLIGDIKQQSIVEE